MRHLRAPSASVPGIGTHNRGKAAEHVPISVDTSTTSATTSYGAAAALAESGLPADATGTLTFTAASPAVSLCTVSDYPTETSCATPLGLGAGSYLDLGQFHADGDYDSSVLDQHRVTDFDSGSAHRHRLGELDQLRHKSCDDAQLLRLRERRRRGGSRRGAEVFFECECEHGRRHLRRGKCLLGWRGR